MSSIRSLLFTPLRLIAGMLLIGAVVPTGRALAAPPPTTATFELLRDSSLSADPIQVLVATDPNTGSSRYFFIANGGSLSCGALVELVYNAATGVYDPVVRKKFEPNSSEGCNPDSFAYNAATGQIFGTTIEGYWSYQIDTGFEQHSSVPLGPSDLSMHSISGADGLAPGSSAGIAYVAASSGGTGGHGAVYAANVAATGRLGKLALIFSFPGGAGGAQPNGAAVAGADGNLYGVTLAGGYTEGPCIPLGCGVIYRLLPPAKRGGAWTEEVLYTFMASANGNDFSSPYGAPVFDAAGNVYGSASGAGSGLGGGVYLLTPGPTTPWALTHLHDFSLSGSGGAFPQTGVTLDASGNVYGTTLIGGTSHMGVVFELTKPEAGVTGPWPETVLHTFTGGNKDGAGPSSAVVLSNGLLFGSTFAGGLVGNKQCQADDPFYNAPGCGTVYVLKLP